MSEKIRFRRIERKGIDAVNNLCINVSDEKAKRLLVLMYRLAHGIAGVEVSEELMRTECVRLNLFQMTPEQFDQFHREAVLQFRGGSYN